MKETFRRFNGHVINLNRMPKKPLILDLGARDGDSALAMKELLPQAQIKCYEPNREAIEAFNRDFELIPVAVVGNKSKDKVTFYSFPGNQWERSNMTGLYTEMKIPWEAYIVGTMNINTILDDLETVDYIKMDIEGAEDDVMKSITTDNWKKIQQISLEIHDHTHAHEMIAILKDNGFQVYPFLDDRDYNGELYAERD